MADAVTSQTLFDGESLAIMKFTNVSDGTGESTVTKVDVSALTPNYRGIACTGVAIRKIIASLNGMAVNILWDASTDVPAFILSPGMYTFDFIGSGSVLINNAGSGVTGDIQFTTIGASSGDTYTIVLEMIKTYAS
jgi:hypothetical protein